MNSTHSTNSRNPRNSTDQQQPRGFLRGIDPRHFLDTYQEWHALVQGFCEVLCPWPPRIPLPSPSTGEGKGEGDLYRQITQEHHYYMAGRAAGVLAWIIIISVIISLLR